MKTIKELLSQIKKNIHGVTPTKPNGHKNWISEKQASSIIRCALGAATHYAKVLNLTTQEVLNAFENNRTYWAVNYYQRSKFPKLTNKNVHVFENINAAHDAMKSKKFRCPSCNGISTDPYNCNANTPANTKSGICDWKAFGLFGCLGKGFNFIIKDEFLDGTLLDGTPVITTIFMPLEFEKKENNEN